MKKLRLLLWPTCNRHCSGCCNQQWNLDALPICKSFVGWNEILLTGGEPMLYPDRVIEVLKQIPRETKAFVYTAKTDDIDAIRRVLYWADGLTVTLHEQSDVESFTRLDRYISNTQYVFTRNLRLNVFKGINISPLLLTAWQVKENITWIENCPLPQDETFMRYRETSL